MINNFQKGISLYYAVLIMSLSLGVALGLNTIALQSFKITREVKKSPPALYAADTGVERALYEMEENNWTEGSAYGPFVLIDNISYEISYEVTITDHGDTGPGGKTCPDDAFYCIHSVGTYQQGGNSTRRAIRAIR